MGGLPAPVPRRAGFYGREPLPAEVRKVCGRQRLPAECRADERGVFRQRSSFNIDKVARLGGLSWIARRRQLRAHES